jgi:hypothetical protein
MSDTRHRDRSMEPPPQLAALIFACFEGKHVAVKNLLTIAASHASRPLVVRHREVHNTASIRPSIEL